MVALWVDIYVYILILSFPIFSHCIWNETLRGDIVDEDEIVALHTHFHKISSTNEDGDDNVIDKGEFAESIHMDEGPFLDRMFNIFDDDGDGTITFEEFLCGMSILCTKGNKEEKLKFSFTVYTAGKLHNSLSEEDVITKDDLKQLLKYKKFATLDDELIDDIIEKTFEDFGAKVSLPHLPPCP